MRVGGGDSLGLCGASSDIIGAGEESCTVLRDLPAGRESRGSGDAVEPAGCAGW